MTRGLAALVALAVLAGCRVEEPPADSPDAASLAPAFRLEALDGATVDLAELRGRPVIVDFWATWCAPCVFQIPVLNEFWEAHRGDGVAVLGVSVDTGGRDTVAEFAAEHDVQYPVLLGDESLAREYGAIGYPTLYVVGRDGRIDSVHTGIVSREELEEALAALPR